MKTEKEKMLAGEPYDCGDMELINRWHKAKQLQKEYNDTSSDDIEKLSCPGINLIKNRTFHISKKRATFANRKNKNRASALSSDIRLSPRSTRQTRKGKR